MKLDKHLKKNAHYVGNKYGKLTVLELTRLKQFKNNKRMMCMVACDCGTVKEVVAYKLGQGEITSCGCGKRPTTCRKYVSYKNIYTRYKSDAKRKGYDWELSPEEFIPMLKERCHYCGVAPNRSHSSRTGDTVLYNGVDRKDSDKGYTSDNTVTSCYICNRGKNNMDYKDYMNYLDRLSEYRQINIQQKNTMVRRD